jgi:hypothetical protein
MHSQEFKTEASDTPGNDLFAEERAAAATQAAEHELVRRMAIPGLLNPYATPQIGDMDEL